LGGSERPVFVTVGEATRPPIGWIDFCIEYTSECATTPQCSRSVIGLIASLTQALTFTMSIQALVVRTTSRGSDGVVAHSDVYSMQKSIQPIGGRVASPTVTKTGRSDPPKGPPRDAVVSPACAGPVEAAKTAAPARASTVTARSTCLKRPAIVAPSPCWGHISHKPFVLALSRVSHFEKYSNKTRHEYL
jgi:hypothetical protein